MESLLGTPDRDETDRLPNMVGFLSLVGVDGQTVVVRAYMGDADVNFALIYFTHPGTGCDCWCSVSSSHCPIL